MSGCTIDLRGMPRIARVAVAAVALGVISIGVPSTAAQEAPEVARTPWQMHIDPEPSGTLSTGPQAQHGAVAAYADAQVPAATAGSWQGAPDGDIIGFDGRVPGFGGDNSSRLRNFPCLAAVDYTYFQTFVTVPRGGTVSTFQVSFDGVDDGARISIYNTDHPTGVVVPGSYVALNGSGTSDLATYMDEGVNRVVITQLDDCAVGNNLREARIVLNGVVIPPEPVDATPPVVTAAVTPATPDGATGWYRGSPTVSFSVTDTESEIISKTGCETVTISTDTAGRTLDCSAASAGGSSAASLSIKRDATAPQITPIDVADATWRNSPLSEQFSASDAMSGLANPDDASFTLTASDESADARTPTVVEKAVVDRAGNASTRKLTALIDMSRPIVVDTGTTAAPNAAGWYRSAITNTFTASDALSGLVATSPATQAVSTGTLEGHAVTVSSEAVSDVAGNTAGAILSEPFKIDLTPPTVALTGAEGGDRIRTAQADAGCTSEDALSGVASCIVTASASRPGTRTLTATATDNAGNTAVVSQIYAVTPPPAEPGPANDTEDTRNVGTPVAAAPPSSGTSPLAAPAERLAVTGAATALLALWALVAITTGGVLQLSARRARPR